jgi:enoyl-CoA hydratase/carnithine racemase
MPENVAGFIPDNGSSRFFANISNCDLPIGLYLAITGARVTGKSILKFGICTHFVPKDKLYALERDLISSVSKTTSKEEINTWLRERLPGYKVPRLYQFVEELPRNAMGKVTKNDLKIMF